MENNRTLDDVVVREYVVHNTMNTKRLEEVIKITKRYIVTKEGLYKKINGSSKNSNVWSMSYISIPTKQDIMDIKRTRLINKCKKINFNDLTDEQLEHIIKIVNPN